MPKKFFFLFVFVAVVSIALIACSAQETADEDQAVNEDAGVSAAADAEEQGTEENNQAEREAVSEEQDEVSAYPTRDIEFLVGHGAGGGTDLFARKVAELLEPHLGVNINVINYEGAGGVIAKEEAAKRPADGYTLVALSAFPVSTAFGTNQHGLDVLTPLARFQSDTYTIMVNSEQFSDIDEFLAYAEDNPGQVRLGATSTGNTDEINARRFIEATGKDIIYVPFDGAGDMHSALLGGHVEALLEEIGPTIDYVESGKMKPILFFAEERLADFPETPTTVEKGWDDLIQGVERGVGIRKDVPEGIIQKLEDALKQVYDSEEYQQFEEQRYLHLREGWLNAADYRKRLEEDIALYQEIIEQLGIQQ